MKAEDLMIGDWYYWESEGKKYPLQVNRETFALFDEDIANFEPILITSEILEKNGYKRGLLIHEYKISDGLHYDLEGGFLLSGYEYGTVLEIKCNYVHELQHALKLCKIEKEIIL